VGCVDVDKVRSVITAAALDDMSFTDDILFDFTACC
jgi:hypothetical protein